MANQIPKLFDDPVRFKRRFKVSGTLTSHPMKLSIFIVFTLSLFIPTSVNWICNFTSRPPLIPFYIYIAALHRYKANNSHSHRIWCFIM